MLLTTTPSGKGSSDILSGGRLVAALRSQTADVDSQLDEGEVGAAAAAMKRLQTF